MKHILNILLSVFLYATLVGCGGSNAYEPETDGGSGGDGPPTSEVGAVDSSGFWIYARNSSFDLYTRQSTAFDDYCIIPDGTIDTTITCIIDVPENHLYTGGLDLQYNVPRSMCRYLVRRPYWYYDYEVGTGPTSIVINRTFNGADTFASATCEINGGAATACTPALYPELNFTISGEAAEATCAYDHSGSDGPNCCTGSYALTIIDDRTASGGAITSTSDSGDWGGDLANCLGGSIKTSWDAFTDEGIPVGIITSVPSGGLNDAHTLAAPNDTLASSNRIISNFYTPATHTHTGFVSAAVSTAPYAIDPIDDRDGDLVDMAEEAYSFLCLDEAREVRNIIYVYIRDWDTLAQYESYISSSGASGTPDLGDQDEGVGCVGIGGKCNDYWDFDDLVNIDLGGPYDTSDPLTRGGFFPEDDD